MSIEEAMRQARDALKKMAGLRGAVTQASGAVSKEDADGDGRLDPSKILGAGDEPGVFAILVPIWEQIDGPGPGESWSAAALDRRNWLRVDEVELQGEGLTLPDEIVDHVVGLVASVRSEAAPNNLGAQED